MTSKIKLSPLEEAAYLLVSEIWERKWDHISEVKNQPVEGWIVIPAELERRNPGYEKSEYVRAITKGMLCYR